ncbi:hypothetical protein OKW21_005485 [Catalinimonas alkaloidigena]|nr:hypothetical protein [Catalinimonas alkaloidigena]
MPVEDQGKKQKQSVASLPVSEPGFVLDMVLWNIKASVFMIQRFGFFIPDVFSSS